ncbi:MAG: tetratricopeptide repeat protein [Candidatus Abyssobacteria bacterium SURF_5]|uniref:Tetratricopeptide repeat protein n=1 Tax=Abyssobacteria bacterium (strain SURF_5) TaxID=2093360 RepID=A0A3A4NTU2_ABYX5|nr:MAG: tetratricopeptide repeat protein [Candidatus Abyssubacteria bacterium SURF_5]
MAYQTIPETGRASREVCGQHREGNACIWPVLLLLGAAVAANLTVLAGGFIWDDGSLIVGNPTIKQWGTLPDIFSKPFLTKYYRPVVLLSFAAEYAVWGLQPLGYHLTNLVLHCANVLLVFFLSQRFTSNRRAAFLGSLLFAIHPVHKGVAYISDRTGLLAAFFFLAALLLYIAFRDASRISRAVGCYVISVALFALGAFSKEEALTLPLMLSVTDFVFFRERLKQNPLRGAVPYIPFLLVAVLYVWLRGRAVDLPVGLTAAFLIEPVRRMMTIPSLLLHYLSLLVFPLRIDYEARFPLVASVADAGGWAGMAVILLVTCMALFLYKRAPAIAYGILWYLIVFGPMSNVIPIFPEEAERELFNPVHFLYLPSIGAFLCAGVGLEKIFTVVGSTSYRFRSAVFRLAIVLITLFFCMLSLRRNVMWRSDISLFSHTNEMHPDRMALNLAVAYMGAGELQKAIQLYERSVALSPNSEKAHNGLGVAYLNAGMLDHAMREFLKGIELKPDDATAYANLAVAYVQKGWLQKALEASEKAVERAPSSSLFRTNTALILVQMREWERAEEELLGAIAADPQDAEAYGVLADLLERRGDIERAQAYRKEALRLRN